MINQKVLTQGNVVGKTLSRKPTKVRLDEVVLLEDFFCHRDRQELEKENLVDLLESLPREGQLSPIEYYVDEGKKIVTRGHRRVSAMRILAQNPASGFHPDQRIEAIEVQGASKMELLLGSVADNTVRKPLTPAQRIPIVQKFLREDVPADRGAAALVIDPQTYARDVTVAEVEWMAHLVKDDCISATNAFQLLDSAREEERREELRQQMQKAVAQARKKITAAEKEGKRLSAAQKLVRNNLSPDLLKHWVKQLKTGGTLDHKPKWSFEARLDREKFELHIDEVRLNVLTAAPEQLGMLVAKLSALNEQTINILRNRLAVQSFLGPQDVPEVENDAYDLDFLRRSGLQSIAEILEQSALNDQEEKSNSEAEAQEDIEIG